MARPAGGDIQLEVPGGLNANPLGTPSNPSPPRTYGNSSSLRVLLTVPRGKVARWIALRELENGKLNLRLGE